MLILFITCLSIYFGFRLIKKFQLNNQKISDFNKKVIFITGTDSGIGNETAKHFYSLGFFIFAGCLDPNSSGILELKSLESLESSDRINRIHFVQLDITRKESIENAVIHLDDFLNKNPELSLHCLINNAGVCIVGEFDWFTLDQIEKIINVNLIGTLRTIKLFLRLIIRYKSRILIIGSVNGKYAYPGTFLFKYHLISTI